MMKETHMAREIAEIPEATARFLADSRAAVAETAARMRALDPSLIVTVARGSSDHAATYLKYAVEIETGVPVASVGPSVASIYRRPLKVKGAVCFGISQSGRSPDTVEMMRSARATGALTVAVTNHPEAPMAGATECVVPLCAGTEQSVAATKTFILSVVACLSLLADWREDTALRDAIDRLPDTFAAALKQDWGRLSARLARAQSAFVLGRGPGFAIASEMALKFKETCGIHAESYSAAEVLHGPAALVQDGFPVLALAVEDLARVPVAGTAARMAAQGADVFITGSAVSGAVTLPIAPALHPLVDPLVACAAFYAFIEPLARRRGFDPDAPPHLRKVTQTV
jgi:glucosamine--fructose-6-phosphate aminotransferase (isomerizing)